MSQPKLKLKLKLKLNKMEKTQQLFQDLYDKYYETTHYSFDVCYYGEVYDHNFIGYLSSIKMDGYEFKLEAKNLSDLIKKATNVLDAITTSRIDNKAMDRIKDVAIIEKEMALTH